MSSLWLAIALAPEYGGNDALCLPRLGHERHCSFCLVCWDTPSWSTELPWKRAAGYPRAAQAHGQTTGRCLSKVLVEVPANSQHWLPVE